MAKLEIEIGQKGNGADKVSQTIDKIITSLDNAEKYSETFNNSLKSQQVVIRAYESAIKSLIGVGFTPLSQSVQSAKSSVDALTSSIDNQKRTAAQQQVYDNLSTKLKQISANELLVANDSKRMAAEIRATQSAIDALIKQGVSPADAQIKQLQSTVVSLNTAMRALGQTNPFQQFQRTGQIIPDLQNKIQSLQRALSSATNERDIARYNIRLKEAQSELERIRNIGVSTERTLSKTFGQPINQKISAFSSSVGNANSVAIEFSRIIQDAPYGMQGIANNLQQLTSNWGAYVQASKAAAASSGQVITTKQLLGGALRSLVSPVNLLTLGISAVTAGWVAYEKYQQRATKAQREAKESTRDYAENLTNLSRELYTASQAYGSDLAKLNTLVSVTREASASVKQRTQALAELKKMYPTVFGDFDTETIKTQKATIAYRELTASIISAANARAAESRIGEKAGQQLSLDEENKERQKQIDLLSKQISEQERLNELPGRAVGGVSEASEAGNARRLNALYEQRNELSKESVSNLLERAKLQEDINDLSEFAVKSQLKVNTTLLDTTKQTTAAADAARNYANAITAIAERSSGESDKSGLLGLDLDTAKIMVEYQKLYTDLNQIEAKVRADQKLSAEKRAAALIEIDKTRAQLGIDEAQRQSAAEIAFAENSASKLEELSARAGITRIKSRQQELAQDAAYWKQVEANMIQFGITAEQLTELRKASEARINADWDAKMFNTGLTYQRRFNETQTQIATRQLNDEYKAKEKALEDWVAAQRGAGKESIEIEAGVNQRRIQLQNELFAKYEELYAKQRELDIQTAFDGDALSVPLARINDAVTELRRNFQGLSQTEITEFQTKIAGLEMQRQQLQLFQGTVDDISGAFGNLYADAIFDTENALQNLTKAAESMAKNILSGLIKIGARYLINMAIGKASMASTAVASSATAATVASAWATAAALVSAASYGANVAAGGAALAGLIASTKALAGFSQGGYTGNGGIRDVAGVVHGKEFVFNAAATQRIGVDNLIALQRGNIPSGLSSALPHTAISKGGNNAVTVNVVGEISGETIKLVADRANRSYNRYF